MSSPRRRAPGDWCSAWWAWLRWSLLWPAVLISDNGVRKNMANGMSGEGEALELALLPFSMEVRPDLPGIMFLEFQDDAGAVYPFAAAYTLSEGALTLQAPEEADCAQLESETVDYHVLTHSLTYDVYLEEGEIWLRNVPAWGTYRNQGTTDTSVILQGVACSDTDIYQGIAAVDLVASREDARMPCRLIFKGGGYSTDAEVISFGFDYVTVSMGHEMVSPESGMQEAARRHTYALEFYNNYPYGFTIRDGDEYFFYQDKSWFQGIDARNGQ